MSIESSCLEMKLPQKMVPKPVIQTKRLGLRNWTESDIAPFVEMCRDEEVMKHFPHMPTENEVVASVRSSQRHFDEYGFTYFAAERKCNGEFVGFIGLKHQNYPSPFTPCVDIGWRLKRSAWGNGLATEGANACIEFAFDTAGLDRVLAVCAHTNLASEAVMRKIGMTKIGSFTHPAISDDSPLNPCLAYQIENRHGPAEL